MTVNRTPERVVVLGLLLLAAFVRLTALNDLPPGWRDDEIVETTLHAQAVLDGARPLFFVQAEGHEPLYHYLSAATIALLGRGLFQVRLTSVAFSLLGIAALYRLARRHFGGTAALVACAGTALSFWSLAYSRVKIRHVGELVFLLLAFYFFLEIEALGPATSRRSPRLAAASPILAGLFLALGLHTYYAARAAPIILAAQFVYLALFHRRALVGRWRGYATAFGLAAVLSAPLFLAERAAGGGAERLSVVGGPLKALLSGDLRPMLENALGTLGMFAFTGDPEALYNIPGRPVFGAIGAAFFVVGLLVALWRWRQPQYAFLLVWLLGGLAPAFVSTPAASLGHTLTAQPAAFILPGVAIAWLGQRLQSQPTNPRAFGAARLLLASLFLVSLAARDLRDYFRIWPALPEVRLLYRANLHAATDWLRDHPEVRGDLAVSTLNVDPRDPLAFDLELPGDDFSPRFFDPARAIVYPHGSAAPTVILAHTPVADDLARVYESNLTEAFRSGAFVLYSPRPEATPAPPRRTSGETFANGLRFLGMDAPMPARAGEVLTLVTHWQAGPTFAPPPLPQPSDPAQTPVGLRAFVHLLGADGAWLAGADDFAAEPSSLRPGDVVLQRHTLAVPGGLAAGSYALAVGLYDPVSGQRVLLDDGRDVLSAGELVVAAAP